MCIRDRESIMAKFDVLDMNGKEVSTVELSDAVFGITPVSYTHLYGKAFPFLPYMKGCPAQ